jgi:apolipoprotein N-acyltransferase
MMKALTNTARKYPSLKFFGLCFILGVLGGCAHLTPLWVKLLIIPSISGILWLTESITQKRHMFWAMGTYFWGYFCVSLYWISVCFHVDWTHFWWLIPPTALGLPLVLAFVQALPVLALPIKPKPTQRFVWLLVGWIGGEILRSFLFTGLPWALAGHILADVSFLAQGAAIGSVYGLSAFVVMVASAPYFWHRTKCWMYASSVITITIILAIWGWHRLQTPLEYHPHIIRFVQPNIAQSLKWDPLEARRNLETLISLSQGPGADIIVWPEAATSYWLAQDKNARQYIAQHMPQGSTLISGIVRIDATGPYNSLMAMDNQGTVIGLYDKSHLVPFGEYIPLRALADKILPGKIQKITHGIQDTVPGPGPSTLQVGNLPTFLPQICYEIIFPLWLQKWNAGLKFDWVVVVTNDAWYGDTAGPYQHLNIARIRAIEYGVPVVRVANTGISAMIDPYGRILQSMPLNTQGRFDMTLPKPLKPWH